MSEQIFKELHGSICRCSIHNVLFGAENLPSHFGLECPVCVRESKGQMREELTKVTKQRDALLAAIEIKRTADVVKSWAVTDVK